MNTKEKNEIKRSILNSLIDRKTCLESDLKKINKQIEALK